MPAEQLEAAGFETSRPNRLQRAQMQGIFILDTLRVMPKLVKLSFTPDWDGPRSNELAREVKIKLFAFAVERRLSNVDDQGEVQVASNKYNI